VCVHSAVMKKTSRVLIALVSPLCIGGCDRNDVTSSETVPDAQRGAEQLSAPVALPDGVLGNTPRAALSDDETVKFEAWCRKYGLDPKDPAMLDADTDGDGFSNREEYIAGTNPRDPLSMPGMLDGVVMKELKDVRIPVILREVKGGKARVERLDTPGMEEWEQGTSVKGLPYRVTAVKQEVKADKHGVFSDVSQVTLENTDTKESVVLIRDLPARTSETHAILKGPGGAEQAIHVDEIIELPGQKDKKFKVIELRPDQVVIEEMGTRKPLTIPKR
jgi:Bacterial TSP3 repeat